VVGHLAVSEIRPADQLDMATSDTPPTRIPVRVGFVVSKAVGNAVVRNQVKRRLRAVTAARLDQLPDGALLVLRALPSSATASAAELAGSVDQLLSRLLPLETRTA
jgi:ribonuclease P protein component